MNAQVQLHNLLFAVSTALDCVEREFLGVTYNHGKRVAYLSTRVCRVLGHSGERIFDTACCAVLHDNALTLASPVYRLSGLTPAALEGIKSHCALGGKNVRAFPFLSGNAEDIILQHHERWDGKGFHGLAGDAIPVQAAVLHLTDVLDTRLALGQSPSSKLEEIRRIVISGRGSDFAPLAADTLLDILNADTLEELSDERIDASLAAAVPETDKGLSTEQMLDICRIFADIIDGKSHFTRLHSQGIAEKAGRMGEVFGLDGAHCDRLRIAGYLHDLGKLHVPLSILEKPDKLTVEEFEVMKDHAAKTWAFLNPVAGLEEVTIWGGNHHERLDGKGYPHGRGADELDFESRLLACCDVYQALTEERPYRAGMPHEAALAVTRDMARQGHLDGDIVEQLGGEYGRG
jgi:HD-GYP domain-containing protein (c-di-GMP phosphodiesterase class II)